jgi:hypothetical protein
MYEYLCDKCCKLVIRKSIACIYLGSLARNVPNIMHVRLVWETVAGMFTVCHPREARFFPDQIAITLTACLPNKGFFCYIPLRARSLGIAQSCNYLCIKYHCFVYSFYYESFFFYKFLSYFPSVWSTCTFMWEAPFWVLVQSPPTHMLMTWVPEVAPHWKNGSSIGRNRKEMWRMFGWSIGWRRYRGGSGQEVSHNKNGHSLLIANEYRTFPAVSDKARLCY